jgi:hypothetical protein
MSLLVLIRLVSPGSTWSIFADEDICSGARLLANISMRHFHSVEIVFLHSRPPRPLLRPALVGPKGLGNIVVAAKR